MPNESTGRKVGEVINRHALALQEFIDDESGSYQVGVFLECLSVYPPGS